MIRDRIIYLNLYNELLMQNTIERALTLKQTLVDFVYDAEDDLAVALEEYAAAKATRNSYGIKQQDLTVNLFVTDGKVKDKTPLEIFLDTANLDAESKTIVKRWQDNFVGLFEIKAIEDDYYLLMNWLTAKTYQVYAHSQMPQKETKRWQVGEIILCIIAPISDRQESPDSSQKWFFFSDRIIKGRLSQPKLAVAIGEFRDNYPNFLYADAPGLLEAAWESVAVYHREFVDYMGSDRLALPGYKLNKKIGELQQKMSDRRLQDAGIDSDKSLSEILAKSGTDEAEFTETAKEIGVDAKTVEQIISNKNKLSMVTPKVDLPPEIKEAQSVTVFSHPKWGQIFLPNFEKFTHLLADNSVELERETYSPLVRKYLEQPEANYYIWQQLKQDYPQSLQTMLQNYVEDDNFALDRDLDNLLLEYGKSSVPELPAIASVPTHLNDLFEAAVAQVQKTRSKAKKKKKKGFLA